MKHRQDIDGLRALAVVAVIIHHFSKSLLPGGYLGVDVFFVISGYVITASLFERRSDGPVSLLIDFYARRVKRLLPALVLFVVVSSALIVMVNPAPEVTLKTGMLALFGLSNLYLVRQATDYFGDAASLNIFTHTWSLGVEEQFYLIFPLIVAATGFGRHNGRTHRTFYAVLAAFSLLSIAYLTRQLQIAPDIAYFQMPGRFWELGAGSLAFWLTQRVAGTPRAAWPAALSLVLLLSVLWMGGDFTVGTTAAAVLATVLLIWLSREGTLPYALFSSRPLVYIGLISYSLYLWHWTVLTLSRWTVGFHPVTVPLQVIAMLGLAMASYHFVEKPLRHAQWSTRKWPTIVFGFSAAATAAVALIVVMRMPEGRLYVGQRPQIEAVGTRSLNHVYQLGQYQWDARHCVLQDNGDVGKPMRTQECTLGDFAHARKRVLALGNSQAAALTHAFDRLVMDDGYAVTITSAWGASPVKEVVNKTPWDKANGYYWTQAVPELVRQLRPGDWVLMLSELATLMPPKQTPDEAQLLQAYEQGLRRTARELSSHGIRLAVMHGLPHLRDANCDPATGLDQWFTPFGGPCKYLSRDASLQRRAKLDHILARLSQEDHIVVIDLFDLFCPGQICNHLGINQTFMYRDMWAHPSIEAARLMAPYFRQALTDGHSEVKLAGTTLPEKACAVGDNVTGG
ncbi:MAG: acyltransferase family protein [Aquabacterium sp.]